MPGQISIRLPNQVIDDLNALARRTGIRRADVVREAIANHLTRHQSDQPTLESLIVDMKTEVLEAISKQIGQRPLTDPVKTKEKSIIDNQGVIDVGSYEPKPKGQKPASRRRNSEDHSATTVQAIPRQSLTGSDGIEATANTDERVVRLKAAQEALGLGTEEIALALNLNPEQVADILDGTVRIPPSRALRMEAKLQQWEAKIQVD
ncbi:MAG: ribbon-helix-helix protein, CopG family [Bradymonadia bacterium]